MGSCPGYRLSNGRLKKRLRTHLNIYDLKQSLDVEMKSNETSTVREREFLIHGLANICIHTKDIEKSLSFYTNLLGFEHYYEYTFGQGVVE